MTLLDIKDGFWHQKSQDRWIYGANVPVQQVDDILCTVCQKTFKMGV